MLLLGGLLTMIDNNDIASIDTEYFDIKEKRAYSLVLQSKNTGHYWYLLERIYNGKQSFSIYHKHNVGDAYHPQKSRPSISACCEYIKEHDTFHLERVKRKNERRERRIHIKQQTHTWVLINKSTIMVQMFLDDILYS